MERLGNGNEKYFFYYHVFTLCIAQKLMSCKWFSLEYSVLELYTSL